MPRRAVFAEQYKGSRIGADLREHREDRDALLSSWMASLEADPRVRAVWLWGSFESGEADDLSDLDPWVIVTDEAVSEIGPSLHSYARQMDNFINGGEAPHNAPPHGGYFSSMHEGRHGIVHVDCYWQALSAMETVTNFFQKQPAADRVYLLDRLDAAPHSQSLAPVTLKPSAPVAQREKEIEDGIGFAWLMFSIAAKYLARFPDSDMALMRYPKPGLENAAALLDMEAFIRPADWLTPEKPLEKLHRIRHLVHIAAQLSEEANKQGMALSQRHAACLHRYLDMIEAILRLKSQQI
jgi:hypothetical protein